MSTLFFCHWYVSSGEPAAVTLNCALWPAAALCAAGAVTMVGTVGTTTDSAALDDVTLVAPFETTTP
jgi:hypothetical protein